MASTNQTTRRQQSIASFKAQVKDRIALFLDDPMVLADLALLRQVRPKRWDPHTNYYGNRKHYTVYRAMAEARGRGEKIPTWNPGSKDVSSYPFESRVRLERMAHGNHKMHRQLRASVVKVLHYLVDHLDLLSGICVQLRGSKYREIYIGEIAKATGLGKRTVQRVLSELTRHQLLSRGVALIGINHGLYKALGLFTTARAMASSLRALRQKGSYKGLRVDPRLIRVSRHYHRFLLQAPTRPSLDKLLSTLAMGDAPNTAAAKAKQNVPSWNYDDDQAKPPPATAPPSPQTDRPSSSDQDKRPSDKAFGNQALGSMWDILKDKP